MLSHLTYGSCDTSSQLATGSSLVCQDATLEDTSVTTGVRRFETVKQIPCNKSCSRGSNYVLGSLLEDLVCENQPVYSPVVRQTASYYNESVETDTSEDTDKFDDIDSPDDVFTLNARGPVIGCLYRPGDKQRFVDPREVEYDPNPVFFTRPHDDKTPASLRGSYAMYDHLQPVDFADRHIGPECGNDSYPLPPSIIDIPSSFVLDHAPGYTSPAQANTSFHIPSAAGPTTSQITLSSFSCSYCFSRFDKAHERK